jgi:hypothetical protein
MPDHADHGRDRLSVLLLCDDRPTHAPNVLEHIRAFQRSSRHRVDVFNPYGLARSRVLRVRDYDVVVVHYTIFVLSDNYLAPWFREQIGAFDGLKVQFIQDEYRQVDAVTARLRELGVDVLFSSIPAEAVPSVYGDRLPGVDVLSTLTGYVPAELERFPRPSLEGRPLEVVYRGRAIPYWLGLLGQEKVLIGRQFLERAASTDLRCDIAWTEAERIYGDEWYRFLRSSRSTLGTESGASIVDFDGSLQERTESYLNAHPSATFEEVERELLGPFEGNAVIEAVSPRVFEAAALGTAMINFTGRYSDVIEPWVHYVPLEKDFSNFAEVVDAVRDDALLERIAARAHADLVASGDYSLRRFVEGFEREIEERVHPGERRRPPSRAARAAGRPLLALEQLSSPVRRAQLPLAASLRTRAADRAGDRLIQRFPEIGALTEADAEGRRREQLRRDLVRLAAATAAHLRELRYFGPPFDIRVEPSDGDRRLTLVGTSEPAPDAAERREVGDRVAAAIREGRLEEIVWNNGGMSGLTFITFPIATLDIGFHVTSGAHRFTALAELARRDPDAVISALDPLFRPRPDVSVHELHGPLAILFRIRSSPGRTATRGAAALRAVLTSRELRPLLRAYLGSPDARGEAPPDLVLEDLFKLSLVAQTPVRAELDRGTLIYRTDRAGANGGLRLDADAVGSLDGIVWDNTASDLPVTSKTRPRVSVRLDGGRHEFRALTLIARRFPALAAPALSRAAGPD